MKFTRLTFFTTIILITCSLSTVIDRRLKRNCNEIPLIQNLGTLLSNFPWETKMEKEILNFFGNVKEEYLNWQNLRRNSSCERQKSASEKVKLLNKTKSLLESSKIVFPNHKLQIEQYLINDGNLQNNQIASCNPHKIVLKDDTEHLLDDKLLQEAMQIKAEFENLLTKTKKKEEPKPIEKVEPKVTNWKEFKRNAKNFVNKLIEFVQKIPDKLN